MRRRRSLRVRITAAFALFFTLGAALLLTAAYLIVARSTGAPVAPAMISVTATRAISPAPSTATGAGLPSTTIIGEADRARVTSSTAIEVPGQRGTVPVPLATVQAAQAAQGRSDLRRVLWWFVGALAATISLAAAAAWFVAGRALAPLRRITATARDVSGSTLDARIALAGPHDELRELAETFDEMLSRLERSFLAQRRFVASASHELRTPLTLARVEAELALTDDAPSAEQLREALTEIHATIERGGDLVEALLALAQAGETLPGLEPVPVPDLVAGAVDAAQPSAAAAGVDLQLEADAVPADAATVRARVPLLRALVDNLLANAIAYNAPGGWVHAAIARAGDDALTLTVANSGPPIDPARVDELFEPFVRAEPSRSRRSGGAGLGLAIVRAVASAHGGDVVATARAEGGLEVTVSLPVIAPRPAAVRR
jgi:signal transduction histidine kinase